MVVYNRKTFSIITVYGKKNSMSDNFNCFDICKAVFLNLRAFKIKAKMARDPVCGMEVDENESAVKSEMEGRVFYFCCPNCKTRFDKDPSKFNA